MKRLLCSVLCVLLMLVMLSVPAFAVEGCIVDYVPDASDTIQELHWAWGYDKPGGKYPDDVAGLYVKNKKAVVALVIGASAARKSQISTLVTDPKLIQFKDAKYSYNELDALKDTLDTNGQFQLLSRGVDEEVNCIMVEVTRGGKRAAQA